MSSADTRKKASHGQEMTVLDISPTDALEGGGSGHEITIRQMVMVKNPFNSQASSICSRSRRSEAGSHPISMEDFRYNTVRPTSFLIVPLTQV